MLKNLTKSLYNQFSQFVKLTRMEGKYNAIAQLELDNPKKKNALSMALLDEVSHAINLVRCHHSKYPQNA